jgi:transcription initiation factor TFIIH subunit 4
MIFQRDKNNSSNNSSNSFNNPSKMLNIHKSDMKIIVQTNNQVIAYVSTELHIAMLKMFIDIQIRMPNMILGRITRSRIKEAYEMGIDSKQIMEFLSVHAHPIVANKDPIIPSNISDQLLIWEAERERVRDEEAIVIDFGAMGIITKDIFNNIYAYGRRLDTILWIDPNNLLIAVKPTGYADIESYIFEELKL